MIKDIPRRVRHNTLKAVGQALEYPCNSLIGYKWMLQSCWLSLHSPAMKASISSC